APVNFLSCSVRPPPPSVPRSLHDALPIWAAGIPTHEAPFSLTDLYSAEEAFVTGTFGGLTPVRSVDGRTVGPGAEEPLTHRLRGLYHAAVGRSLAAREAPASRCGRALGTSRRHSCARTASDPTPQSWTSRCTPTICPPPGSNIPAETKCSPLRTTTASGWCATSSSGRRPGPFCS